MGLGKISIESPPLPYTTLMDRGGMMGGGVLKGAPPSSPDHTYGYRWCDGWWSVGRGPSNTLMNRGGVMGGGVEEGCPPPH